MPDPMTARPASFGRFLQAKVHAQRAGSSSEDGPYHGAVYVFLTEGPDFLVGRGKAGSPPNTDAAGIDEYAQAAR